MVAGIFKLFIYIVTFSILLPFPPFLNSPPFPPFFVCCLN